ncbi:MAG: hypothetical protein ABSA81_03150 [Candidatus Bathyarchaeia archaeon]
MSVTFKDFERLDIRVAKLVAVENIPGMKKIMKAKVDLGDRTVYAIMGGAEYYKPSDLQWNQELWPESSLNACCWQPMTMADRSGSL